MLHLLKDLMNTIFLFMWEKILNSKQPFQHLYRSRLYLGAVLKMPVRKINYNQCEKLNRLKNKYTKNIFLKNILDDFWRNQNFSRNFSEWTLSKFLMVVVICKNDHTHAVKINFPSHKKCKFPVLSLKTVPFQPFLSHT